MLVVAVVVVLVAVVLDAVVFVAVVLVGVVDGGAGVGAGVGTGVGARCTSSIFSTSAESNLPTSAAASSSCSFTDVRSGGGQAGKINV